MAQRDKYYFQQISQDWGAVEYKDVPSYSKTSVGTTGDAYLIRQFLKQFFPFLKTSVNKSGGSVRVKLQEFEINFSWEENGTKKNFLLNSRELDNILQPLFEGQGFDGMTDSSYTKPLPKMYNDEGFEVSYGYIYLFVDPENITKRYEINLDAPDKTRKKDVLLYRSLVLADGSQLKIEMPEKTLNFIKGNSGANTQSSDPINPPNASQQDNVSMSPEDATNVINSNINKLADKDFDKSSEYEKAMALFVAKNLDVLKDMGQNAPELLQALSKGVALIANYGKENAGELAPFTPLENQQELEDQLKEEDFDLSDVDLQEIDLTGLDEDFEINEDELGNLDLTEFDELSDFVNTELMPDREARDYAILKTVQLMELSNTGMSIKTVLDSLNTNNKQKYTEQEISDLQERDFIYRSNNLGISTKGEKFIDEYELKNKQDSVAYPLINAEKKIDIDNLDIYQKEIIRVLSPMYNVGYPFLTAKQIYEKIDDKLKTNYPIISLRSDLEVLKVVGLVEQEDQQFNLVLSDKVKEVVEKLNEENLESREFSDLEKSILLSQRRGTESSFKDIFDSVEEVALQKFQLNTSYLNLREKLEAIEKLVEDGYLNKIVSSAYGNAYILTEKGEEVVEKLIEEKSENEKLTPTKQAILRDLFRMNMPLSASDITEDITISEKMNLTVSMVFDKLSELKNAGYVNEINTQNLGIQWKLTPLGDEYVKKNSKTGGEYREEKKQQKIEENFGSLNYDLYLILNVLNENDGMLSAKTVTDKLQKQFNKNPKWDENDVLSKLRELPSMGLVLEDTLNATEYFEISAYGEDVVKYLIAKERKGDYPKSKPTQQAVGERPSPSESATIFNTGKIKVGNDGNLWKVTETKNGVKRWVKIK